MNKPKLNAHSVEKIGGTSMSRVEEVFENIFIGGRSGDDLYQRVFVVSAYGGMTNALLEHKKTEQPGVYALYAGSESEWAWGDALSEVGEKMRAKNADIFDTASDLQQANQFIDDRIEGTRSCLVDLHRLCSYGHFQINEHLSTVREMLSALGEIHSAFNTSLLLNKMGVNAVFTDLSGWREQDGTDLDMRIQNAFNDLDLSKEMPIVTGYAQSSDGLMKDYGRGYSEVTFSKVACLTKAREAIIHKEFHLSSADPNLVGEENVQVIGETNYDVADQLSNLGMEAIHPRAAKGLRQMGIPLRITNAFEPEHFGTIIQDTYKSDEPRAEIVTGIKHLYEVEVFNQDMVGIPGGERIVSDIFARFKVRTVTKNMNANTVTHYVATSSKQVRRCVEALEEALPHHAKVTTQKVSLVSVIGSNLGCQSFLPRSVLGLHEAGIETIFCGAPARNVDMQFVVHENDFEKAQSVLHKALIECEKKQTAPSLQAAE